MDPFRIFESWYEDAKANEPADPNAIALATASPDGRPHVRYVLFKDHGPDGFTVYTNTGSVKGEDMDANPHAAIAIHWKSSYRQVRVEGPVERVDDKEADAYFASRGREKQLSAAASKQSRPLASREAFARERAALDARHGDQPIPRPAHWTGYRIIPERIEFWEGTQSREHHRRLFVKQPDGEWSETLLYP